MSRDWAAARAKVDQEGRCRVCGALGPLDAAHIIPRSRIPGPDAMLESNIVPLCRTHHVAFDEARLDLLPFLSKDEQGFAAFLVGLHEAYTRVTGVVPSLSDLRVAR